MRMAAPQSAWRLFGGFVFLCMGLALAVGARRHAAAAADWSRQTGAAPAEAALLWVYRIGGALFAVAGLALLAGTGFPEGWADVSPAGRLAVGALFLSGGTLFLAVRVGRALREGRWSRILGEARSRRPWSERFCRALEGLMALAFLVFGAYLLAGS